MKCYVCGNENITPGMSECPDCHFLILKMAGGGNDSAYKKALNQMALEYQEEIKTEISIGLMVYSYEMQKEQVVLKEEQELTLLKQVSDLVPDSIYWYDEKFVRYESDEPVILTVVVNAMDKRMMHSVKVKVPSVNGFWKIGIKEENGLNFRILVGEETNYSETEKISMVR